MIHIGKVELPFSVQAQSMDVSFDPTTHQQVLSFKFGVSVPLPQMLQQLQKFQFRDAMPLTTLDNLTATQGLGPGQPGLSMPSVNMPARQGYPQQAGMEGVQPVMIPPTSNQGGRVQKMWDAVQGDDSQQGMLSPGGMVTDGSAALPLNMVLVEALRENSFAKVQQAIAQKADVNCTDAPHQRTPLIHALEAGGNVEMVNALLQNMANVNAATARGKTPLHFVIQQYMTIPPVVIRMLLSWKADLLKPDSRGTTPLQTAKLVAMQLNSVEGQSSVAENTRVRQLLNEVTEQPTVAVVVVDAKEVKRVLFADMENDKLVFHTESSVGLYSLKNRQMIYIKRLRQLQVASSVQHVAVNPHLGTIAVCLSVADSGSGGEGPSMQNVTIVWPNGHLQDEEPVKLTMKIGTPEGSQQADLLPPCVTLSRSQGPQMLLSRLIDGQVFCWRLNSARSQLVSEVKLLSRGGLMATSDDGCWIAVVNKEDESKEPLEVWAYENFNQLHQSPKHLVTLQTRPVGLAIIQQQAVDGGQPSCLLAVAEAAAPGMAQPPVEIFSVSMDGSISTAYRIQSRSLCHTLFGSELRLLIGQIDGLAIVCKPSSGAISMSHDSPGTGQIAI
eukprot:CAMPEP_0175567428 /NCGR_PEP_ID=MMETSP0096-20121207/40457_1 /TAXON_ID=311494 /ORGANISM="Alexandrium monilatum, Strain CCMP3105" /LENGTH=612 /DNA_ID=CAMNT_0016870751 /DNA_START=13 /DNA_END=1849 /DNA_ORIENTATION=-